MSRESTARKIIFDTDPGQDDAAAILMALASPQELDVLGIVAVAGIAEMPTTRAMFETLWETDRDMMPEIRRLTDLAERAGKPVTRIASVEALDAYSERFA
jgi:inosine-uridine nucleoside N-ribohydrolase